MANGRIFDTTTSNGTATAPRAVASRTVLTIARGPRGKSEFNYASILGRLRRSREAIALYRKTLPAVARAYGESDQLTLIMMNNYGAALYEDDCATLDDISEATSTLVKTARTARRVLGGAHPLMLSIEKNMRDAQAALRSRTE